jgi:type I restriction enzyme R subunit
MDYEFIRGQFTEAELEAAIITLFEQQGNSYVHGDSIHHRYEDILIEDDLRPFLTGQYSDLYHHVC